MHNDILLHNSTDLIHPLIQVVGLRSDYKLRKWKPIAFKGVPETGESDPNKCSGHGGHFVYRAKFRVAYPVYCGTSVSMQMNLFEIPGFSIQFSMGAIASLLETMACGYIVPDIQNKFIEIDFVLEKTGKYVYAELADNGINKYQYSEIQ